MAGAVMANPRALSNEDLMRALTRNAAPAPSAAPLSWGDVPGQAVTNAPASAGAFVQNIIYPFLHPIETAQTFYEVGQGLLSKAGVMEADEAAVDAIGQFFVDRYGSMDNLKKTLATDPIGVAADAATVLSGGAALGARAPGVVGQTVRAVGTAGRAIDPVTILGKTAKVAGRAASYPLGMTTGAGPRAIQEAGRAGLAGNKVFAAHMRGNRDINEPVAMAKRGVSTLADRRRAGYKRGMAGVDPTMRLDLNPVGKAILRAEDKIYLEGVAKSDDAVKTLEAIKAKMREYSKLPPTVEVLDHMKQAIGEIRQKQQFGTLERGVADDIYNSVKDAIVKQAPQYADVMKGYSEASENLGEISKTFSLGEKATKDTALRKLQSTMRNNVNTNYGARTKLGDQLSQLEPDLIPSIAGQALSSPTPRGLQGALTATGGLSAGAAALAGMLDPTYLTALAVTSPRLVGEAAYLSGRAGSKAAPAARAVQQTGRVVKDVTGPWAAGAGAESLSDDELMQRLNRGR